MIKPAKKRVEERQSGAKVRIVKKPKVKRPVPKRQR